MKKQTTQEWLSKNVTKAGPDECWNATGKCYNKKNWHVAFKSCGKRHLAHRAAWAEANRPITNGLFVLHRCDNPKCCNPAHLFLGTQSANALDMWEKGRARPGSIRGVSHGPSQTRTLSADGVLRLFSLYRSGLTQKAIASQLGMTDVAVSNILTGKTYPEFAGERESVAHMLGRGKKKVIQATTRAVYRRMTFA